jgi:hypothetical protein
MREEVPEKMPLRGNFRAFVLGSVGLIWLSLCVLLGTSKPAVAQSPQPPTGEQAVVTGAVDPNRASTFVGEQQSERQLSGYILGTVKDRTGAAVAAQLQLTRQDQSQTPNLLSADSGQFFYTDVPPGPFQLTIAAEGFETQRVSGVLHSGEAYIVPEIRLALAVVVTEVQVQAKLTPVELSQDQIKEQEKQRILGFVPNFYVSYVRDALPLNPRQKFRLAWKTTTDPFTFVGVAALAGVAQATNAYPGYGQGWDGYAKRFGASYTDAITGTFVGSAILPSLLKQDPRYFYKGTGSIGSRLAYALASPLFCKGDNMRWQPNYSNVAGAFASASISYAYYPNSDRNGAALVFQNSLIRLGEMAFEGVLQEFVLRRLTPHRRNRSSDRP